MLNASDARASAGRQGCVPCVVQEGWCHPSLLSCRVSGEARLLRNAHDHPVLYFITKRFAVRFRETMWFFFFFFKSSFRKVRAVRFLLPQFEFRWGLTGSSYLNRALGVRRGLALECEGLQFFSWSSVTTCTEEYESLSQTLTPAEIHDPRAKGPELWLLSEESLTLASGSRLRFVCVLASPPHRDLPV